MKNHHRSPNEALDDLGVPEVPFDNLGDGFGARANGDRQCHTGAETPPKFKLNAFDDIKLGTEPFYLIKGIIPRTGLVNIWGPPKCGKSFIVFDMMMCVVRGCPYRGRRTQQGPVVYCALEGAKGFTTRIEAYRQRHFHDSGKSGWPFNLIDTPMRLVADEPALIASVKVQVGDQMPAAIVIDTLNRSITGSESNDKDMAAYLRAADALRYAFGCVVILIHHCGIDDSRPRGHTSLPGNVDAQIAVKRDATKVILATVEYMKDGPEGENFASRLEQVTVGIDDDGDAISSCVVEPVESVVIAAKPATRLPKAAQISLRALHEALIECGAVPPGSNHIPADTRTVMVEQWREYAYRMGISTSDDPKAKQVAFRRASEALLAARAIGVWQPHVWATL